MTPMKDIYRLDKGNPVVDAIVNWMESEYQDEREFLVVEFYTENVKLRCWCDHTRGKHTLADATVQYSDPELFDKLRKVISDFRRLYHRHEVERTIFGLPGL